MRYLLLPLWLVCFLTAPLFGEETAEKKAPPRFGELEFVEALLNPTVREVLGGQVVEIVGELTLFGVPNEETGRIASIGFSKTYGTAIYKIWCQLKTPLTEAEFDQLSAAPFLALKGVCQIKTKTKEAGSDLWYDFSVVLKEGEIVYQAPAKEEAPADGTGDEAP